MINLGFVPVGTKKIDVINFLNDGSQDANIELTFETKNEELSLDKESLILPKYNREIKEEQRKQIVTIIYEPKKTNNLHEKIEVNLLNPEGKKSLGFIEIVASSVVQQMSIVFQEGGGPHTDINFGLLYYGQNKECNAFLVNNGPKEMLFKFNFYPNKSRKDFNEYFEDEDFASTPEETGIAITQRVLSAEPENGMIKPYSQIPIKFLCNTKLKKKEKGWRVTLSPEYDIVNKKSINNLRDKLSIPEHFQSLAAIKFEEENINILSIKEKGEDFCKPVSVFMEVKAISPDITIDKTELNFSECYVKEKKLIKLLITNKNSELPVDFNFNKITNFKIEPSYGKIKPSIGEELGQVLVNVYFQPENIGKFNDVLILKYINNMYEIPIKIFAVCKTDVKLNKLNYLKRMQSSTDLNNNNKRYSKLQLKLGLKKNISDFSEAQLVPDEIAMDYTNKPHIKIDQSSRLQRLYKNQISQIIKKISTKKDENLKIDQKYNPRNEMIKKFEENFKIYEKLSNHRSLANLELVRMRRARRLLKPMRIKSVNKSSLIQEDNEKDKSLEALMSLRGNRLDSPKLKLPEPSDKLWVISPIGQYEGIYEEDDIKKDIGKTPDDMPEDNFPKKKNFSLNGYCNFNILQVKSKKNLENGADIPRTHQEIRECSMELTGEELQKIQVGVKEINFGQIFINSEVSKTFWIKNNLKSHIFVRLDINHTFSELIKSNPVSQVIQPGELFGFKLSIFSKSVKKIIYPLKYTINYIHNFNLKLCADIIKAKLDIQNNLNKFVFKNDKIDIQKIETSLSQKLKLFNSGNAAVEINFEESKDPVFKISPMKEIIPSNEEKDITITFNPFESQIQKEKYQEQIKMNIINEWRSNDFSYRSFCSFSFSIFIGFKR